MKTFMPSAKNIERKWYVVDATDLTLGRLASQVAAILRGKNKPEYTPFLDMGDYVIIVNASKVKLTGKKLEQKVYRTHTGQPGGLKETVYKDLMQKKPELAVKVAVKGMLPKNTLGRAMGKKLKVYAGPEHPHAAQKPREIKIDEVML
jgi:large subunit ribosomal protein L13